MKGSDGTNGTNGTNGTGVPTGGDLYDVLQKAGSTAAWYSVPTFKGALVKRVAGNNKPYISGTDSFGLEAYYSTIGMRAVTVQTNQFFEYIQGALSHKSIRVILPVSGAAAVNNIGIQSPNVTGSLTAYTLTTSTTAYNKMAPVEAIAATSTTSIAGFYQPVNSIARLDGLFSESIRVTLEFSPCSGSSNTNKQGFIGISSTTGAPTDVDPSTLLNILGFGFNSSDTYFNLLARSTGSVTKIATTIPKPTADRSSVYRVIIESVGGTLYLSLEEVSTSSTKNIWQTSSSQVFPVISTMMSMRGWVSAGGTNNLS